MIKINLLPVARAPKAAPVDEARVQMVVGLAVIIVLLGTGWYRWVSLSDEVVAQTALKDRKQLEVQDLKKKVAEVEDYQRNQKLLEDKNRIIEQLRKNQGGPVQLLDYVSQSLDPLRIWLIRLEDTGQQQIAVEGKAFTTDDVVEFVKNLQRTNYFAAVILEESRQTQEEGVPIYQFRLKMTVKA